MTLTPEQMTLKVEAEMIASVSQSQYLSNGIEWNSSVARVITELLKELEEAQRTNGHLSKFVNHEIKQLADKFQGDIPNA